MKRLSSKKILEHPGRLLPWAACTIFILVAWLYKVIDSAWLKDLTSIYQFLAYALFILLLAIPLFLLTSYLTRLSGERQQIQSELDEMHGVASAASRRLSLVMRARQQLVEANSEADVIQWLFQASTQITSAEGASFVPLDDHGQPLAAIGFGATPIPVPDAWLEYLASPAIRNRCNTCEKHNHLSTTCPLLKGPYTEAVGMYCLPLQRGEREYGVLNLYIPNPASLNDESEGLLQSLVDETATILEGMWLRKRQLDTLRQLQEARQKTDLRSLLSGLLKNVHQTLEADFALLMIQESVPPRQKKAPSNEPDVLTSGDLPEGSLAFLQGILQGVLLSGEAVTVGNLSGDSTSSAGMRAVLAAPLLDGDGKPFAVLAVGNRRINSFRPRQLTVLQTVAGQLALVVQNANQMAELEYKTMMAERTRLAREIHDGLAQTLGFMKLQVAQMKGYLEKGEAERLKQVLGTHYNTLADAYEEARNAIDGLRISPCENSLDAWLEQVLTEFQENAGPQLSVQYACEPAPERIPSEVHAQLIRIVQESLSNVRKHSDAKNIGVRGYRDGADWVMEIRDDGQGFSAEDVSSPSQHGLRGMRERAELIGADFQIISQPGKGTTVRVCLPLGIGEGSQ